jgi:hypothetical protein
MVKYSIKANNGWEVGILFVGMKEITATVGASATVNI